MSGLTGKDLGSSVEPKAGAGAWGVQQVHPWLLLGLPGNSEFEEKKMKGRRVNSEPPQTSPTEGHDIRLETKAGTGARGVQQEQPWLLPGLPGCCENKVEVDGPSVRPGPPHTSPTVVLTGSTWECGQGSIPEGQYSGSPAVLLTYSNTLTCMSPAEQAGSGAGQNVKAGTGAWGVQQELPESSENEELELEGPSVRPGPPHTSPTVVLTGSTRECGVGSSPKFSLTGELELHLTSIDKLPCMIVAEEEFGIDSQLPVLSGEAAQPLRLLSSDQSRQDHYEEEGGDVRGARGEGCQGLRGGRGGRAGGQGGGQGGRQHQAGGGHVENQIQKTRGCGGARGQQHEGRKRTGLRLSTWNKGGANQDLWKKRNEIALQLQALDLDCLGVTEANLKTDADMQSVHIPGYVLKWDSGRENNEKKISRVAVYIKEELSFEVVTNYMKDDLMPEVWLRLGHQRTRRTLVGFVYREHTPVGTQDSSIRNQEVRLQKWLSAREAVWRSKDEVFMLGDINLDMMRIQGGNYYDKGKMLKRLVEELGSQSWVQLIKSCTHFWNRAGECGESLIDHIWTNTPSKVGGTGQVETGVSDHHLVWVERRAKNLVERVRRTEKRSMKNFSLEKLETLCRKESWKYLGVEVRNEEMLKNRVEQLEEKINRILEEVAPMRIKTMKFRGRPKWLSPGLVERMKERQRSRKKASRTKSIEDERVARQIRNEVSKEVKNAEKEYMRRKLENLTTNSSDSWAAVGEFLGWRKPVNPTMLVQDGNVLTGDQELAEAMLRQYTRKEAEVEQALGEAEGDFLEASRRMTRGNKGVFNFKKVTVKEVAKQLQKVDNKESFGHDGISYGFLKKMKRWIIEEITEIINLSLEVRRYPRSWKISRVKPLHKGDGCDRHAPKSFRPVALLAAISRITEALLASQLDVYQEGHGLLHRGVHGFRKGRGTNTAMLKTWEYVLARTEKGELVAVDLLDTSAAFDTLVHIYLLRKMEVEVGMGEESLEWLASYLEGWLQYVVVGASSSQPRSITRGAPQGGGQSPLLFRGYTNVIPEAGLKGVERLRRVDGSRDCKVVEEDRGVVSTLVDGKENLTSEERMDKQLRKEGVWCLQTWRKERTGDGQRDRLLQKTTEEDGDVLTTIYADDTQSRTSAKTKEELERRNSLGLTNICKEMKALRLKVNEDKTTYMVLATQGRRRRENLESEIVVCGERVRSSETGKCLGLILSNDLTWQNQVDKVVKSCSSKLSGLWKCTGLLRKDQRKVKAEGIILSRLNYCLEVVSQGRKSDLERLQSVQSKAARWVLQTRRKDWSLTGGLRKLGWLSMAQQAAYDSIKTALRTLQECKPERLYDILTEEWEGERRRRIVTENRFKRLKSTTKKAWSYRSLRWLEQMPESLITMDVTQKVTKTQLKAWVRHHVPVRGDRILWGKLLTGEMRRKLRNQDDGGGAAGDGGAGAAGDRGAGAGGMGAVDEEGGDAGDGRVGAGDANEEIVGEDRREERSQEDESSGGLDRSAGLDPNPLRGRRNLRVILQLLLLTTGVCVAVDKVMEDKSGVGGRERSWGRREELVAWKVLGGSKMGGHRGSMGRVKSGEG